MCHICVEEGAEVKRDLSYRANEGGEADCEQDEGYAIMQQGQVWFQSRMPDMLEAVREGLKG